MQFCIMGPIEIHSDRGEVFIPSGAKQRLLLASLLLHAPRIVSSDRLVDVMWGDRLPEDPGASLRTQVSRLRALLADAGVEDRLRRGDASGYGLSLGPAELDSAVFEDLLGRAREAATPGRAIALIDEALGLWRDDPFGEFNDAPHFLGEASRLRELAAGARQRRVEHLLALGRNAEALAATEALLHADPLSERSRALAMQALYESGRQHEALATFQEYRRLLSEELGLQPSPTIRVQVLQRMRDVPLVEGTGSFVACGDSLGLLQYPVQAAQELGERRLEALEREILGHTARPAAPSRSGESRDLRQDIRFAVGADGVRLAYATVGGPRALPGQRLVPERPRAQPGGAGAGGGGRGGGAAVQPDVGRSGRGAAGPTILTAAAPSEGPR